MKTVCFSGGSDDLVEIEGNVPGCDEYGVGCNNEKVQLHCFAFGPLRIYAIYDGCWSFAAGLADEDCPWPDLWRITISKSTTPYSSLLKIEMDEADYHGERVVQERH